MPRPAPVMLPKRHALRFPDRCPVCGKAAPGHALSVDDFFGVLPPVAKTTRARWDAEIPVCKDHARRLRNARMSDHLSWLGLSLASLALLVYLAGRFELFAAGWWSWVGVLVLGLVLPRALISAVARPLFEIQSDDDYLVVHARNPDYAEALLARNPSEDPPA